MTPEEKGMIIDLMFVGVIVLGALGIWAMCNL